ncbi:MAG: glycoside hydrolase, partial [Oscillospiraceae bacterium]|nr:glycoside hydrolase [Oscillospiraceae bacterium]
MKQIYPGIFEITLGEPEALTPLAFREYPPMEEALNAFAALPCPFDESDIPVRQSAGGFTLELPLSGFEQLYGFGLQLKSFAQLGKKKTLRCNADPVADTGDSHAPVPFYVSTEGYGVFVDSARQVSFYCGANEKVDHSPRTMAIEVPAAQGVTLIVFAGGTMLEAVRKYNLFSGGGAMPPLWGLGVWYRAYTKGHAKEIEAFAREFREKALPVTVLGLEPGWHTAAYSCSYVWNEENFPDHKDFTEKMRGLGYQLNLWEHAFVHPQAPFHDEIAPYCGEYEVFNQGLTPDFTLREARDMFAGYHQKELAEQGISGFKLDECDGSDYTGG